MDTMHIQPLWRRCFDPLRDVVVPPNIANAPNMISTLDNDMKAGQRAQP